MTADRAKSIKTKARINLEDTDAVKKQTRAEAQRLERELQHRQQEKSLSDEEVKRLRREVRITTPVPCVMLAELPHYCPRS